MHMSSSNISNNTFLSKTFEAFSVHLIEFPHHMIINAHGFFKYISIHFRQISKFFLWIYRISITCINQIYCRNFMDFIVFPWIQCAHWNFHRIYPRNSLFLHRCDTSFLIWRNFPSNFPKISPWISLHSCFISDEFRNNSYISMDLILGFPFPLYLE